MTYKDIINRFRQVTENHLMLKDFGYGQLSDLKTQSQLGPEEQGVDYPYLFLLPGTHTRNEPVMSYQFNMIVMDMARGEEGDEYDNYITIQSQCQQYIDDVLANLYYYYRDQPEIQLTGISYTPFKEKYQDALAGMTATITIQVPTPLNDCIAPIQTPVQQVEVTNLVEYLLGPDPGDNKAFTYATEIYDPNGEWFLNQFRPKQAGRYRFVIEQPITVNEPAPGEQMPNQPILSDLTEGPDRVIQPLISNNWPTQWESNSTVYNWSAVYEIDIPTPNPLGYTYELITFKDQSSIPETTIYQKVGGTLKIYRLE